MSINQSALEVRKEGDRVTGKEREILRTRKGVESRVKDSLMLQMEELQQWGIMTDWRYSYFTL